MSDELAIMVAATSDPEFKHRLDQLRSEQAAIKRERQAQQEEINQNANLVSQAQQERAKAERVLDVAANHEVKAREEMDKAATAFQAVRDEEARFEAGRALVDKQQADVQAKLNEWHRQLSAKSQENIAKDVELKGREEAVGQLEQRHAAASRHAAAFRAALGDKST